MTLADDLSRFLRLPADRQRLLVRAALAVLAARAALAVLPFRVLAGWALCPPATDSGSLPAGASSIGGAVSAVARRLPGTRCLPQAISVLVLLRREGLAGELRIGMRLEAGRVRAHAWVESRGAVVIGHTRERFLPLPMPGGPR